MRYFLVQLMFVICMLIPISSFADVIITEVMYDVEGSDAGKEWIEIYNNGDQSVLIDEYHFYEADVHHGLDSGGETLFPGDYAVIVQNLDEFNSYYNSDAILIKSSFSLNNTGENLGVSDSGKNIIHSVSYSSSFGAVGDGNSLNYGVDGWFQSVPTPGSGPGNPIEGEDGASITNYGTNTSPSTLIALDKKKQAVVKSDYTKPFLLHSSPAIAHSTVTIEAFVERVRDGKSIKKKRGYYYLNLGDGTAFSSSERIKYDHIYTYPGIYTVVLEYYRSKLSKQAGEKPHALKHISIDVIDSALEIHNLNHLNDIVLYNNTSQVIDLHGWNLSANNQEFVFPEYSIINPKQELVISSGIHELGYIHPNDWVLLRNEHNRTIFSFSINKSGFKKHLSTTMVDGPAEPSTSDSSLSKIDFEINPILELSPFDKYLQQNPNKEIVSFSTTTRNNDNPSEGAKFPILAVILAGATSLILIVFRFFIFNVKKQDSDQVRGDDVKIELIE